MSIEERLIKLEKLAKLLREEKVKEKIVKGHVVGVNMYHKFSELELMEGIKAIENSISNRKEFSSRTPIGKIGIVAPYNTPSFAFGYGCELVATGNDIEIYFSSDLIEYREVIADVVKNAGIEDHIKIFMGSQKDFVPNVLKNMNGLQIYGGDAPFVFSYAKMAQEISKHQKKNFVYCFEGPGNDPAIFLKSASRLKFDNAPHSAEFFADLLGISMKHKARDFWLEYCALNAVAGTIVGRGQSCMAFRRIIAHKDIANKLENAIVKIIQNINNGLVSDENQTAIIGQSGSASTNKNLFARTLGYSDGEKYIPGQIDDALNSGSLIYRSDGSKTNNKDQFLMEYVDIKKGIMKPFVATNVSPESRFNTEETFLPIVNIIKAPSDIAAIDYATRGRYCLRTSLYGNPNEDNYKHVKNVLSLHFGVVDENQPFFSLWDPTLKWGPGMVNNRSGFVKVFGSNGREVEILGPRRMFEVFSKEYVTEVLSRN